MESPFILNEELISYMFHELNDHTRLSKHLRNTTGWTLLDNHSIYKDNILMESKLTRDYPGSDGSYNSFIDISVVNDIKNDNNPLLIYSGNYKLANSYYEQHGWVNINEWSIYAYHLISEAIQIIKKHEDAANIKKFKETFRHNRGVKEEALKNIKDKLKKLYKDGSINKMEIIKLIQTDRDLEDAMYEKDKEDAKFIAQKLGGKVL
jgi:hypothetical protein